MANPKIETIRPNGEYWIMHDKYIQKASLKINEKKIVNITNTHMFPFQHFNKHFWDSEFSEYRKSWAKMLIPDKQILYAEILIQSEFLLIKHFPNCKLEIN